MWAVRAHTFGSPEVLCYEDTGRPEPSRGEARVRIEAAGVNFIDINQRRGSTGNLASRLPFTLGMEGAGVVDAVGPGVSGVRPGDRVAYCMQLGSYAEYAVVPAWTLAPVPEGVDSRLAAAVMLQGLTAHYLTESTCPLHAGATALVHAAAGGTGLLLVQMLKRWGTRVIGTVSTEEKARLAREAGADEVILYTKADFEWETKRLTGGKGVDVVYDSVGKTTFDKGLNCLKPRGGMVLYGRSSGVVPPFDLSALSSKGSLVVTRPYLSHFIADRSELLQRAGDLFEWIGAGELDVRIDKILPLAEAAEAHASMEGRKTKGKVLLIPPSHG
ncbi:MAG TPA: NADPH:quinone reductase [Chloroflexi bacterium]|nr:NADPH:quinone reductase [Chloroflexota bacterium]